MITELLKRRSALEIERETLQAELDNSVEEERRQSYAIASRIVNQQWAIDSTVNLVRALLTDLVGHALTELESIAYWKRFQQSMDLIKATQKLNSIIQKDDTSILKMLESEFAAYQREYTESRPTDSLDFCAKVKATQTAAREHLRQYCAEKGLADPMVGESWP